MQKRVTIVRCRINWSVSRLTGDRDGELIRRRKVRAPFRSVHKMKPRGLERPRDKSAFQPLHQKEVKQKLRVNSLCTCNTQVIDHLLDLFQCLRIEVSASGGYLGFQTPAWIRQLYSAGSY